MTEKYVTVVTDYAKSLIYDNKLIKNDFNKWVHLNSLVKLSFDVPDVLLKLQGTNISSTNDPTYIRKAYNTVTALSHRIESTKYNIFIEFLNKLIQSTYDIETKVCKADVYNVHYSKFSKDSMEFMNMLHKNDVPFLDGVL
jgi:hypothetical protein